MELRCGVYYNYTLRDKEGKTIFLISAENLMDPGEIPGRLLVLSAGLYLLRMAFYSSKIKLILQN